jgi:hypothetical protein
MFIGQRLGSQIPFGVTYFVDAKSGITLTTRCENNALVRERNVDPELITTLTNCDAIAVLNIFDGQSAISVTTNLSAIARRVLAGESNITVNADIDIDYIRERNQESDIDITANLSANGGRYFFGASDINAQISVDTIVVRQRNDSTDIDVETVAEAIGELVAALFSYDGDIAPGEVIKIDTDDLTIEDGSGNNLRQYFDGEWYRIDPEVADSLSWTDSEADRDIEIVIEKEDRSV